MDPDQIAQLENDDMIEELSGGLNRLVRDSMEAQVTSPGLNCGVLGHDTLSSV